MINLFYITNNIEEAKIVDKIDIDWIFVDLEYVGKSERQIGRNTVLSNHSIEDVPRISKVLKNTKILLRCNPIGDHSIKEFDEINNTPDIDMVMLPYFKSVSEVETFISLLDTKKKQPALLIETVSAIENLNKILKLYPFKYVHVGLNDIHIERQTSFMFEPYIDGLLAKVVSVLKDNNVAFGVGGIGKIGSDLLPTPERVINELVRLNSSGVILSRSFKGTFLNESRKTFEKQLKESVTRFREHEKYALGLSINELNRSYLVMKSDIEKVVSKINDKK